MTAATHATIDADGAAHVQRLATERANARLITAGATIVVAHGTVNALAYLAVAVEVRETWYGGGVLVKKLTSPSQLAIGNGFTDVSTSAPVGSTVLVCRDQCRVATKAELRTFTACGMFAQKATKPTKQTFKRG